MPLEFSKAKDGEKICCLGAWKLGTFKARACKSIQWGPNRCTSLSTAGNSFCPRGFAVAQTIPRHLALRLHVLPCIQVTPGSVHLQLRFRGRVFRAFQPYSQTNALLEQQVRRNLNQERFAVLTARQAHTVMCLWFHSEILYIPLLEVALGY